MITLKIRYKKLDEMYNDGTVSKIAQKYNDYDIEASLISP